MKFPGDLPKNLQPCIIGVGESVYTRRGGHTEKSEFELCLESIRNAAADAGISASQIDGYTTTDQGRTRCGDGGTHRSARPLDHRQRPREADLALLCC